MVRVLRGEQLRGAVCEVPDRDARRRAYNDHVGRACGCGVLVGDLRYADDLRAVAAALRQQRAGVARQRAAGFVFASPARARKRSGRALGTVVPRRARLASRLAARVLIRASGAIVARRR